MMVSWFNAKRNRATLGEMMVSGEPWVYEFRARMSELRRRGYQFELKRGSRPSDNLYTMTEPTAGYSTETSGQMIFA